MPAKTAQDLVAEIPLEENTGLSQQMLYENLKILHDLLKLGVGITGTFTTVDGKTVTYTNGIITGVV